MLDTERANFIILDCVTSGEGASKAWKGHGASWDPDVARGNP
jgi:hypothetical protein